MSIQRKRSEKGNGFLKIRKEAVDNRKLITGVLSGAARKFALKM